MSKCAHTFCSNDAGAHVLCHACESRVSIVPVMTWQQYCDQQNEKHRPPPVVKRKNAFLDSST